jgi:hypothetical protein
LVVDVLQECGCQSAFMSVYNQKRYWTTRNSGANVQLIECSEDIHEDVAIDSATFCDVS